MKSPRTGLLHSASRLSTCGEGAAGMDTQAFQGRSRNFQGLGEWVCVWGQGRAWAQLPSPLNVNMEGSLGYLPKLANSPVWE